MEIIDRRPNPHGKNLENRRRVLVRARDAVRKATRDAITAGRLREVGQGGAVSIPSDALHEPSLHRVFSDGVRGVVLSGNRTFSKGDRLARPPGGGGGRGQGEGQGGENGGGEDGFRFVLSRDEFLDLMLDDLELPDLVKRQVAQTDSDAPSRAGLASEGSPSQLDLGRSMRLSVARRIGLKRPRPEALVEIEARIAALEANGDPEAELHDLWEARDTTERRLKRIPWIDPVDMRFRRFTPTPKPTTRAVMFCVMDVSGSMTERMKDLAKQFFLLLHVFLERRYKRVELVFIRHADTAEEVDEDAFFHDPRTGGTVVSTALAELLRVQRARFAADGWNIYVAQASDGDNAAADTGRTCEMLRGAVLPLVQYYAYIEVVGSGAVIRGETDLWRGYRSVAEQSDRLVMRQVGDKRDIFPVFRDLFARRADAG